MIRGTSARILLLAGLVWLTAACGTPYGIYHRVQPGQTLYRIAMTYNVTLAEIMRINRIGEPTELMAGQLLFVPGASTVRHVPVVAPAAGAEEEAKPSSAPRPPVAASAAPPRKPRVQSDSSGRFRWPVSGSIISGFGERDSGRHDGIDIKAPEGTPIYAAASGRVIYSGDGLRGYGNLIIVKHDDGTSTIYSHNRENLVDKGDFVAAGDQVGTVGQTGRASTAHLHFEIRNGKTPVNPEQYLPPH